MMETFQDLFHTQWQTLHDPHVRSLAWILTSPSMLAKESPVWKHQIANLFLPDYAVLQAWLADLDQHPTELHEALALHKHRRLGHYAENLLAFYLKHQGMLYAHGLQVHVDGFATLGEFDFLLRLPEGLLHWEIATKFYLFEEDEDATYQADLFDYLGPNLADTLGAKMDKIFRQQLALSHHAAAQKLLPEKVIAAKALIKGWLFYRESTIPRTLVECIADNHCRGYWWTVDDVSRLAISYFLILERLQWLAPAQTSLSAVMEKAMLHDALHRHFQRDSAPVMLAIMRKNGDVMQEFCRGMVVPNDWPVRAQEKRQQRLPRKVGT
ncbi:MAG: DUF1853 family protein [Undibacterium sp.]|nr:DUF1853 family protein [Undibacterium sp.]